MRRDRIGNEGSETFDASQKRNADIYRRWGQVAMALPGAALAPLAEVARAELRERARGAGTM